MIFHRSKKADPAAKRALEQADEHLKQVQSRSEEVHHIAEASREFRRRNHFAEDLYPILYGRKLRKDTK